MSIKYEVSKDGFQINVFPEGVINVSDTIEYFKILMDDKRVKKGAVEIVHFKDVTNYKISFLEGENITRSFQEAKRTHLIRKTVFVCETELAYGMGRMLQTLHKLANPDHEVLVIKSESELDNI